MVPFPGAICWIDGWVITAPTKGKSLELAYKYIDMTTGDTVQKQLANLIGYGIVNPAGADGFGPVIKDSAYWYLDIAKFPDKLAIMVPEEDPARRVPAYRRKVHTVFQDYALFPHMDVRRNVWFPLKMQGVSLKAAEEGIRRVLRVAMQKALKDIQRNVVIPFVYVTHDQTEALTMSDRIAVMKDGRVHPLGTPDENYNDPAAARRSSGRGRKRWRASAPSGCSSTRSAKPGTCWRAESRGSSTGARTSRRPAPSARRRSVRW